MPNKTPIENQIEKNKASEAKTGRRGRPRGEPSKVTTVYLPKEYHLPNGEMIERIESWMDRLDPAELAQAAATRTLKIVAEFRTYEPYKFQVASIDMKRLAKNAAREDRQDSSDHYYRNTKREIKKNIRLKVALAERIRKYARKLDTKPSDVIRLAMVNAYPNGPQDVLSRDVPEFPYFIDEMNE